MYIYIIREYDVGQGYINSFLVDSATGRLIKGRRLEIQPSVRSQGPLVTSISFTAWAGRGGRDPSLLVSCAANALFLYKSDHSIIMAIFAYLKTN